MSLSRSRWLRSIAEERGREARAGHLRSALHGVPIAVKDNFYLKGFPLARGSRTSPDYVPNENAPMVQRLIDAGTIIIGKTTTPEFGWKGTGISPLIGITRNPWNAERNSGGSSAAPARCRSRLEPTPAGRSASPPPFAAF